MDFLSATPSTPTTAISGPGAAATQGGSSNKSWFSRTNVLAATAAAGALGLLGLVLSGAFNESPEKRKERRRKRKERRRRQANGLRLTELLAVLEDLGKGCDGIMSKLYTIEQRVRMSAQQRGHQVSDEQVRQALLQQFVQMMAEMEQAIYKKHGTTEAEVKWSRKQHEEVEEVEKHVNKVKKVFTVLSKQPGGGAAAANVEVPEDLTRGRILEMVQRVVDESSAALSEILEGFKQQHNVTTNAELGALFKSNQALFGQFQQVFTARSEQIRTSVHKAFGVTDDRVLNAAIMPLQQDQEFMMQLMQITQSQQEILHSLGLGAGGM